MQQSSSFLLYWNMHTLNGAVAAGGHRKGEICSPATYLTTNCAPAPDRVLYAVEIQPLTGTVRRQPKTLKHFMEDCMVYLPNMADYTVYEELWER